MSNIWRIAAWFVAAIVLTGNAASARSPAIDRSAAPAEMISVMTYNVKGLPWPIASDRNAAFSRIVSRLTNLRAADRQPSVIVLQEAFTPTAKAIARDSGYRYIAEGPDASLRSATVPTQQDREFAEQARWLKGEGLGKFLGSGLLIASDYPIIAVRRAAFPDYACAGFDCLANKGVLLVKLRVPGRALPVEVATTHLNSRHASGVPAQRSLYAYRRQLQMVDRFLTANADSRLPLIFAGDFNASSTLRRSSLLAHSIGNWSTLARPMQAALIHCLSGNGRCRDPMPVVAQSILDRGRDWQFFVPGSRVSIRATSLLVPFGREPDGSMLSDHMGYLIGYRLRYG